MTLSLSPRLLILQSSSHSLLSDGVNATVYYGRDTKRETHFTTFLFISSLAPGAECHFRDTQTA